MNVKRIRKDFPILNQRVNNRPLVYLDNAATSQKPLHVLNTIRSFYKRHNANVHRGIHTLSQEATEMHEEAREKTRRFINAGSFSEIVFTRNATEGINLVAQTFGRSMLKRGDEILATAMEHHSNIVPWQMLEPAGIKVKYAGLTKDGELDIDSVNEMMGPKTKLLTVTEASNVLATINDTKELAKLAHDNGARILVDACQSVPHMPVDVRDMDVDFLVFSGHKMCGPTGIGTLYGKRELLDEMPPFLGGGDMIREVSLERTTYNDIPYKFEAGTPNIAGAIGLGAAIDYLKDIGMEDIRMHTETLMRHALDRIADEDDVTVYGPADPRKRSGVLSFSLGGVHPHDIATILDRQGIAIRSGHHCAQPLIHLLGLGAVSRASFYLYNTKEEVDKLIESFGKVRGVFA
ncbi:MAG: cysteine desulfurase [archaeon]